MGCRAYSAVIVGVYSVVVVGVYLAVACECVLVMSVHL